jgi:hypothetical protein
MPKFAQGRAATRAPRVGLAGSVLVLALLENGRQLRGRLHQLSVSGGLLRPDQPLDEGIKVELVFHVGKSTVRSRARMLFPMWATQGCLQPFRFDDLSEQDSGQLQADLQKLLESSSQTEITTPADAITEIPAASEPAS